jgi:hypothetical protein
MSPVEVPLSESGFDRNISVHTPIDSSEHYKSGGTLRPHRPDVVIIKVNVHIVVLLGLHTWSCEIWVDSCRLTDALRAYASNVVVLSTKEVERPKPRFKLTVHERRPCTMTTGS